MKLELTEKVRKHIKKYDLSINNEIAIKKIQVALDDLKTKKDWKTKQPTMQTKQDWEICLLALYGSFQKMRDIGIDLNRSDDWFINNYGKKLTAQYMYPALINAIKEKGLICLPRFYMVGNSESFIINENEEGRISVQYEPSLDKPHLNISSMDSFKSFACVIRIKNMNNEVIHSDYIIFGKEDILKRKSKSTSKDKGEMVYNYKLKKKAPKEDESVWEEWTERMIEKTLLIAVLQKARHALPELKQVMQFSDLEDDVCDSEKTEPEDLEPVNKEEDKKIELIDFDNPSEDILVKTKEIEEEYKITPQLKDHNRKILKETLDVCQNDEQKKMALNNQAAAILALGKEAKDNVLKYANICS